jgi:hypothetical protein
MSINSRSRRLVIIIIILLISNIGILAFFLWPKLVDKVKGNSGRQGYGMADMLKKEVGLDSVQIKELDRLREDHWKKMRPMFEELRNSKNQFYSLLKSPETPDSVINRSADVIAEKQKAIDLQVFQHFRNSRRVCRPDQTAKYDSLTQIVIKKMAGLSRGSNNRRKEGGK